MRVPSRGPLLLRRWTGAFAPFVLAVVAATVLLDPATNAIEFERYSYDRIRTLN